MMNKDKCLLDLPVLPYDRNSFEDNIRDTYIKDIENVKTQQDLKSHIDKWANLWLLKLPTEAGYENSLLPEEIKLLSHDFDFDKVLSLLKKKIDNPSFDTDENARIMATLVLPRPLLIATMLSDKYGVCSNLGMIRLFLDPYPEFDDCCHDGCGDLRMETVKSVVES